LLVNEKAIKNLISSFSAINKKEVLQKEKEINWLACTTFSREKLMQQLVDWKLVELSVQPLLVGNSWRVVHWRVFIQQEASWRVQFSLVRQVVVQQVDV
jgi:cell division inhibitor SulA